MTGSWLWRLVNLAQNRIPDPIDHVEMRRRTFGAELSMVLTSPHRARPAIEHLAADYGGLLNDLYSYRKEIRFEGELTNSVLVVRNFLGCSEERAFAVVTDLAEARLAEFRHAADESAGHLRHWLAGVAHWHENAGRYTGTELGYHPWSGGPTGIGTSSLRISSLLPATPV